MAAPAKYPAPHEQLLALARRARLEGLAFEEFWERAVRPGRPAVTWATPIERRPAGCVVWPRDTRDRNVSISATLDAMSGWRRAYLGLPAPRAEAALLRLRPLLDAIAAEGNASGSEVRSAA